MLQMYRFYNPGGITPGACSQSQNLQGCTPVYHAGQWWCSCLAAPPPSPAQRVPKKRARSRNPQARSVYKTQPTLTSKISQFFDFEPKPMRKRSVLHNRKLVNPCGCMR